MRLAVDKVCRQKDRELSPFTVSRVPWSYHSQNEVRFEGAPFLAVSKGDEKEHVAVFWGSKERPTDYERLQSL